MKTELAKTTELTSNQKQILADACASENAMIGIIQSGIKAMNAAGQVLLELKDKMNHGEWVPWLKANMPEGYISEMAWVHRTQSWMRIHKVISECSNPELLERAQTVRQLFQLAGLIPDAQATLPLPQLSTPTPTVLISKFTKFFQNIAPTVTPDVINSWPEADRKNLRETLKPAAEMYYLLE